MGPLLRKTLEKHGYENAVTLMREGTFNFSRTFTNVIYPRLNSKQHSGWKIHIAANPHNADAVAKLVIPYLFENNIASKVVKSKKTLRDWINNNDNQRGKFLTIYPYSYETAKKVVKDLDVLLSNTMKQKSLIPMQEDKETPPNEAVIGQSGFLFIRYGEYDSGTADHAEGGVTKAVGGADGPKTYAWDQRDYPFPEFILDAKDPVIKKNRIMGDDAEPFPGLNMRWRVPGTKDLIINWASFPHNTWADILGELDKRLKEEKAKMNKLDRKNYKARLAELQKLCLPIRLYDKLPSPIQKFKWQIEEGVREKKNEEENIKVDEAAGAA